MTRRNFETIAYELKWAHPKYTPEPVGRALTSDDMALAVAVWFNVVDATARACATANGRFDRERFITACTPRGN